MFGQQSFHIFIFISDKLSKLKHSKYSSEYALCFCTSFFHIASLYVNAALPALNKFFEPFRLGYIQFRV